MTTFCWLPPDSSPTMASRAGGAHVELLDPDLGRARSRPSCCDPPPRPERRKVGDGQVLPHRLHAEQGVVGPVGRHVAEAGVDGRPRVGRRDHPPADTDDAGAVRCRPDSRLASSSRPDPVRPAMPTTSPGVDVEVERRQLGATDRRGPTASGCAVAPRGVDAGVGRGLGDQLTAEHQVGQALVGELGCRRAVATRRPSRRTVDAVGDLQHLVEVVGDEQHGGAGGGDAAQGAEAAGRPRGPGSDAVASSSTSSGKRPSSPAPSSALATPTAVRSDSASSPDQRRRIDVVAEGVERGAGVARGPRRGGAAPADGRRRFIRKLSDTVIASTRPRSWWTKRSPAPSAADAEPSSNGTPATSATAPGSGSWYPARILTIVDLPEPF